MKTGDAIATVARPIAKAVDATFGTDWLNCLGCKRMESNLNAGMPLWDAFYDRFWGPKEEIDKPPENFILATMDFVVTKTQQIAVQADNLEQAIQKSFAGEGNVIS